MSISYKERIARRLTATTAMIILVVFGIIYGVVRLTVVTNIDRDLQLETDEHKSQIFVINGEIRFVHKGEWQEEEHSQLQLNPIFIEIVDAEGNSMDRSPNLLNNHLSFFPDRAGSGEAWTVKAGSRELRQMQIPLYNQGIIEGYLLVAKSFQDARETLTNLRNVLLVLYPLILISLFLIMRNQADQSIQPIRQIIQKTNLITQSNLNERIPLSGPNDEIEQLTRSINDLLHRLEQALKREKQFTSDASHELRTPLSVLRGTLEVMIRKPRTQEEYQQKIQLALQSIDRMTATIEQLLVLARVESGQSIILEELDLLAFCEDYVLQKKLNTDREINFLPQVGHPIFLKTNEKSLQIILDNLVENALKYSDESQPVDLILGKEGKEVFVEVQDKGPGISEEDQKRIFDPFYRGDSVLGSRKPGAGLGLAIVKKLCDELNIQVAVESESDKGSRFRLVWYT
ncbi:HAMP domain-containing histidine kinase [Algoriphagus kandeliae]|uniref:histidine kinase n=1 Tax=Algoriphagus kandeliae TaxID=2562278 RepID=A0A4Y9QT34_9BACT|nr:HAMP domain-containing sensor histidine kinase [Algoriphagus kandeliae]TFV94313.1 HAMP domain-containing histidine kinase [Algoriphagus kandeliae]